MTELLAVTGAMLGGLCLGAFFFVGLWWTVRRGVAAEQPALLFLGSMLLRTLIVVAGLYFMAGSDWRRLIACLAGFILARFVITRLLDTSFQRKTLLSAGETQ